MEDNKLINSISKLKDPISIEEFINLCLYSNHGYYSNKIVIGKKGDFTTSPEISQLFGEILGLFIFSEWKKNINKDFNLIELGPGNATLLIDKLKRLLSAKGILKINISAVGGPCLASGLANKIHSSVVIANENIEISKELAERLRTKYYHTSYSNDLNGVEVSAAIKNIFSMAVGAAKGLCSDTASDDIKNQNYLNTASALIKQSIHEMEIFVEHLKGKKETVKGLAGLGDLYVSSGGGRNAKMGSYIGEGLTFSETKKKKMRKVTVEGADLAIEIGKKVKQDFNEKKLPLMIGMIDAIVEDKKLEFKWQFFK